MKPLIEYYTGQFVLMCHTGGRYVSVRTYQDIIDIVASAQQGWSKTQLMQVIRVKALPSDFENIEEAIERSVDLAERLLIMFALGKVPRGFSGPRRLLWKGNKSLAQVVAERFIPFRHLKPNE